MSGTLRVRKGATVAEGDPIADPGPTGEPEHEVPYLHLGIRVGESETYVDPIELLPPRSAPSPPPAPAAPPASNSPPASAAAPAAEQPTPTPAVPEPSPSSAGSEPSSSVAATPDTPDRTADDAADVSSAGLVVIASGRPEANARHRGTTAGLDRRSTGTRTVGVAVPANVERAARKTVRHTQRVEGRATRTHSSDSRARPHRDARGSHPAYSTQPAREVAQRRRADVATGGGAPRVRPPRETIMLLLALALSSRRSHGASGSTQAAPYHWRP